MELLGLYSRSGRRCCVIDYVFSLVMLVAPIGLCNVFLCLFSQLGCTALSVKNVPFTITALQQGRSQIFALGENFEMLRISAGCRPRLRRSAVIFNIQSAFYSAEFALALTFPLGAVFLFALVVVLTDESNATKGLAPSLTTCGSTPFQRSILR